MVDQMRRGLRHAPRAARRAKAAPLAAEGDQLVVAAVAAAQPQKAVGQDAAFEEGVELVCQKPPHTLYVLDEPTVGLHMADVEKLIHVLHRAVNGGHSVVVIEHDLDVIAEANWVIDLGPDGGKAGGQVVAATTPEGVVKLKTHTGVALKAVFSRM